MSESEMKSVVSELVLIDYQALKAKMQFMQATHASDHLTPTHTLNKANDADRPKSFYMKKGLVKEQQGQIEGTVGWGGKKGMKPNILMVPGYVNCSREDEATILYRALRNMSDYQVISADDDVGGKFLYITGIPSDYAGFSYLTKGEAGASGQAWRSTSLPVQVFYNVVVIRAAGKIHKLLSTYPAGQSYIDSQGTGYVVSR